MKVKVKAKLKNLRISPRKVRVSADMVRNCDVKEAIFRLESTVKRANEPVKKLIESAMANAQNNFDLNVEDLRVSDIQVGEGITLKRWTPRAYGRATQILKRSSHVYLILEADKGTKKSVDKKDKDDKKEVTASDDKTEGKKETVEKVEAKKDNVSGDTKKGHFEVESKRKESREK
jgi:large subunit ribosomal protein L22